MPASDCTEIASEGQQGRWFNLAVHTAERCAPQAHDTLHARFVVNTLDGRVMRCDDELACRAVIAPDGIPLDRGRYVEVPDRSIEIRDVASWQHPTKGIFARLRIDVRRVVLTEQGTYATFDVTLRALDDTPEDRAWLRGLYDELCVANFGWSFAIRDDRSDVTTTVECTELAAVGGSGLGW